jgi:hypothetical protein
MGCLCQWGERGGLRAIGFPPIRGIEHDAIPALGARHFAPQRRPCTNGRTQLSRIDPANTCTATSLCSYCRVAPRPSGVPVPMEGRNYPALIPRTPALRLASAPTAGSRRARSAVSVPRARGLVRDDRVAARIGAFPAGSTGAWQDQGMVGRDSVFRQPSREKSAQVANRSTAPRTTDGRAFSHEVQRTPATASEMLNAGYAGWERLVSGT